MELMQARRRLLTMNHRTDTSPRIAEHGVYWSRTFGVKTDNNNWCITDWYNVENAPFGGAKVQGFIGADSNSITFQYRFSDGSTDWYYFNGTYPRALPISTSKRIIDITFSVQETEIDNSYAYIVETGQIFFAGKNTPYYGHANISELN